MITTTTVYTTRDLLSTALPLHYVKTPTSYAYTYKLCSSIAIDDLSPGDIVQADACGEASTVSGISNAMHARYIKLLSPGIGSPTGAGLWVSRPAGVNVSAAQHHSTLPASGSVQVTDTGRRWLVFVMYAASLTGPTNSLSLVVNSAELMATVTRFRPDVVVTP